MLDGVQAGARCEHPAGEDPSDFALQRHLVDLDKRVGVGRLGRRARITGARGHLQRTELHGFTDRCIERDDAAGNFIEAGKYRATVLNLLR